MQPNLLAHMYFQTLVQWLTTLCLSLASSGEIGLQCLSLASSGEIGL
jgi:hypothetical protein